MIPPEGECLPKEEREKRKREAEHAWREDGMTLRASAFCDRWNLKPRVPKRRRFLEFFMRGAVVLIR
jgi:hypothetical protein